MGSSSAFVAAGEGCSVDRDVIEALVSFLSAHDITASPIPIPAPIPSEVKMIRYDWDPGPGITAAVEGHPERVRLVCTDQPIPLGDGGGPILETQLYLQFEDEAGDVTPWFIDQVRSILRYPVVDMVLKF